MNPRQIKDQVENNEVILLDVREDNEWNEGHIAGAKHIPLNKINEETTKEFSKDRPIYTYCRSGGRAGKAESILRDLGFSKAENIGGIIDWQSAGGELVK